MQYHKLPLSCDVQVEKLVDEALKQNNFQHLESFLQHDIKEGSSFHCSRQFVTKLDKLFLRVSCIMYNIGFIQHFEMIIYVLFCVLAGAGHWKCDQCLFGAYHSS